MGIKAGICSIYKQQIIKATAGGPVTAKVFSFTAAPLDPTLTFTASSFGRTMYNSSGILVYAPMNMCLQSNTFSTTWGALGAGAVAQTFGVSPDGTSDAWSFSENTTSAITHQYQSGSIVIVSGTSYTLSAYIKQGALRYGQIGFAGGADMFWVTLDTQTGTITDHGTSGSGTYISSSAQSVGNGWYRIDAIGTLAQTSGQFRFGLSNVASGGGFGPSYAGTGTGNIGIYGAQVELTSYDSPHTYNATTSSAYYGPRFDYNPSTLAINGLLLEEQRTNGATYSTNFSTNWSPVNITYVPATSPDGLTDALLLTLTNTYGEFDQSFTATGTYIVSCYVKAGLAVTNAYITGAGGSNLAIYTFGGGFTYSGSGVSNGIAQALPNGWYRISATVVNPNGLKIGFNGSSGSTMYVYGFQIEAGTFATSYIPTTSGAATRALETLITNSLSWFNSSQGTWFQEQILEGITPNYGIWGIFGNSTDSTNLLFHDNSANSLMSSQTSSGYASGGTLLSVPSAGSLNKFGVSYGSSSNAVAANGTLDSAGNWASATAPAGITQYQFLGNYGATSTICGWARSLSYYNTALTPSQVQTMSGQY